MNEKIAEKMIEGSLFKIISDKEYLSLFVSFVLFFDFYLLLINNYGLMNSSPDIWNNFPIEKIIVSIALFSLLASVVLPTLFWWCNNCIWRTIELLKIEKLTKISDKDVEWLWRSIDGKELMSWAIKNSNPVAMAVAKEVIEELNKIQKNRANLFSLACFIFLNYYIATNGLVSVFKDFLPNELRCYFPMIPMAGIIISLYGAFFGISIRSGNIVLPGLNIKDWCWK